MKTDKKNRESRVPWLAVRLVGAAGVAWVLAIGYSLWINPEIRHFVGTDAIKQAWAEKMSEEHGAKVVVYGGSSCEFSLDGERLLEKFNLPCVNLGRGAGMGAVVLTMAALEETRPGDTLIVALEPGLITDELEWPTLGLQFSAAARHPDWVQSPLPPAEPASWIDLALALRPGGFHSFTMMGKLVRGGELYRYRPEDMRPSGFNQTPVRVDITGPPRHGLTIPESSRAFLRSLSAWCERNQVRLAYSLPWGYTPEALVAEFQEENRTFLNQIKEIMPVLDDPVLGAYTVREHFADTAWHLDEAGSALRTDSFGRMVAAWDVME